MSEDHKPYLESEMERIKKVSKHAKTFDEQASFTILSHPLRQDNRMTQDKTGQDRTRQDKTGQDRTGQDKTGQDKTRQNRTGQDKTRQDKAGQGRTPH